MGPLLGLMALSVGSEMLARHQQDQKLESIRVGVEALKRNADETVVAQLDSAEQALQLGGAAILDRSEIPAPSAWGRHATICASSRTVRSAGSTTGRQAPGH